MDWCKFQSCEGHCTNIYGHEYTRAKDLSILKHHSRQKHEDLRQLMYYVAIDFHGTFRKLLLKYDVACFACNTCKIMYTSFRTLCYWFLFIQSRPITRLLTDSLGPHSPAKTRPLIGCSGHCPPYHQGRPASSGRSVRKSSAAGTGPSTV